MIEKIKRSLKKRKVKIFLVFVVLSGMAWLISNLSETYNSTTTFQLRFVNVPDSFLLKSASKDFVKVRLRAGGFQFIRFNFKNKTVRINMDQVQGEDPNFFISPGVYRGQIERQLSGSMSLLEIDQDTLFFDLLGLKSKEVPIRPRIHLDLAQNYLLDGNVNLEPSVVTLRGPGTEIDTIQEVRTSRLDLSDRTEGFSERVAIEKPGNLSFTKLSNESVLITGKLARFSEKVLEVPIRVKNLPEGTAIRTFPAEVPILCKAKLDELKKIDKSDFQIIADYAVSSDHGDGKLRLSIGKKPDNIHSAQLLEHQVEFILKRE